MNERHLNLEILKIHDIFLNCFWRGNIFWEELFGRATSEFFSSCSRFLATVLFNSNFFEFLLAAAQRTGMNVSFHGSGTIRSRRTQSTASFRPHRHWRSSHLEHFTFTGSLNLAFAVSSPAGITSAGKSPAGLPPPVPAPTTGADSPTPSLEDFLAHYEHFAETTDLLVIGHLPLNISHREFCDIMDVIQRQLSVSTINNFYSNAEF